MTFSFPPTDPAATAIWLIGGLAVVLLLAIAVALILRPATSSSDLVRLKKCGFRRLAPIGSGGFADVYRARRGKRGAIKVLRPGFRSEPHVVKKFVEEGSILRSIANQSKRMRCDPRIGAVRCHSYGQLNGASVPPLPYLHLEYLRGPSLEQYLQANPNLPVRTALGIARQIAAGLIPAHAIGVAHRDLKPDNIVIENGRLSRIRLLDFGTAKLSHRHTVHRDKALTPDYVSPEQAGSGEAVDHRTDLYSLGVILYRMVGGRLPFKAENPWVLIDMHLQLPPPPLAVEAPGVAPLVHSLLSKQPDHRRPSTAVHLVRALDQLRGATR